MPKKLTFPDGFLWGTSTAAAQIETASEHNWKGVQSIDGYTFLETSEHEKRRMEDVDYITQLGSVYRCGVDWARLQKAPFADFEQEVVDEYQTFFKKLNKKGTKIMFVLHHFMNPLWFENNGSWEKEDNIPAFVDYAKKCIQHFAEFTYLWNTFNEPNVYALNGWITGAFPPMKKNYFKGTRVLKNLGRTHNIVYDILKKETPDKDVGISFNWVWFEGINFLGNLVAKFVDNWFHNKTADYFQRLDFWGVSYYAHIPMNPFPITETDKPGELAKRGYKNDMMWSYRPEGMARAIRRLYKKYPRPIIITESGIATNDAQVRIDSINDYLQILHALIQEGIPIKGYIHWSTMDNFEWNLGPTFRFGLVQVDLKTKDRTMTKAGEYYTKITQNNGIILEE